MRLGAVLFPALFILCFACSCQPRDEALFENAQRLWMNDLHVDAADKLRLLVAEYPESKKINEALFRLGEIHYLNMQDPSRALDYFIRTAEREGNTPLGLKTNIYIAEIYEDSVRNYELAILQYQKILNDFRGMIKPDEYRMKIANAYFSKGEYDQAIIDFESVIEEFPSSQAVEEARYQAATCYFVKGHAAKALDIYGKVLEEFPGGKYDYDIRLGIGMCLEELDQPAKALDVYEKMREDYPDKKLVEMKIESVRKRASVRKR